MNNFRSNFDLNKRQRNGVFFLLFIILTLQIVFWFVDFSSKDVADVSEFKRLAFQNEMDSLVKIQLEESKPKLYPFNPNYITDFKGYQLGMSIDEIDRLLNYRQSGKFVNSVNEFQLITKISDSLLNAISPFFKFPEWVTSKKKNTKLKAVESTKIVINEKDINRVNAEDLIKIRGIGDKLTKRILDYRKKLQGYSYNSQLYEVWNLDKKVADEVLKYFNVLELPRIKKLNVNTASFKEIISIVYVDYELTKKILDYKTEVAEIQSIDELKKIDGFPLDKFERITLYLMAE